MAGTPYVLAALTGVIGTGKSIVADAFAQLGAEIIDADLLAREVVVPGSPALQEIVKTFGPAVLLPDGTLDRKALGSVVFNDPKARQSLEKIMHPKIRDLFLECKSTFEQRNNHSKILLYVVPLLFESSNQYPEMLKVIVVSAPRELCIARIMERDGCSREFAEKKIDTQIPIEEKVKKADYVIENSSTKEALHREVQKVYDALLALL